MQTLRDNPECAREEYSRLLDEHDPGLHAALRFDPSEDVAAPYIARGARPAVAVLREQGVNSQTEMAAVFTSAGFDAYDVHMTDIFEPPRPARPFSWAGGLRRVFLRRCSRGRGGLGKVHSVQPSARDEFAAYFERHSTSRWACATAVRCCRR